MPEIRITSYNVCYTKLLRILSLDVIRLHFFSGLRDLAGVFCETILGFLGLRAFFAVEYTISTGNVCAVFEPEVFGNQCLEIHEPARAVRKYVEKLHRDSVFIIARTQAKPSAADKAHPDTRVCDILFDRNNFV